MQNYDGSWRFLYLVAIMPSTSSGADLRSRRPREPPVRYDSVFSELMGELFCFSVQYQMEMMRNLRHVNIDHLHVGWYQSTYLGSFINRALLDSQFNYQHSIEESVVLIYGEMASARCGSSERRFLIVLDRLVS